MFELLYQELKNRPFIKDKSIIIPKLSMLLKEAFNNSMPKSGKIGIAFSGGLDSGLLSLLIPGKQPYTIGLRESSDIDAAITAASQMGWNVKIKQCSFAEAEQSIRNAITLLHEAKAPINPTAVGIAAALHAVLTFTQKDNIQFLITGLGAEELFAGYKRHTAHSTDFSPEKIHERLWHGLFTLEERDIARDLAIANHFNVKLITPFLDQELVRFSMQIHPSLKVDKSDKKIILREAARLLGLPECMAGRKKIAVQYGSSMDAVLQKLASSSECSTKQEFIHKCIEEELIREL